jgi:sugar phosphate isomerase/epimerase
MAGASDRLGIEFISVMGLDPVAFVELAANLGCRHIGLAPAPFVANPHDYPLWSLRSDLGLRRDTVAAMNDHGVSVSLGEGFIGLPNVSMASSAGDLDLMCELGATRVNMVSCDPDSGRALDELALFAEMAAMRGLESTLEFVPGLPIGGLPAALAAVRHVGRADLRLMVDMMHIFRSGSTVADLAALDPALIGHVQICDVPLVSKFESYADEARDDRLSPGEGELPLFEALQALPRDVVVGLEVPMLTKARAGIGPQERLFPAVEVTRSMLELLG